jgi:hypothetical protein
MPALGLAGIDGKPDGLAEGVRKAGHLVEETFTFGPRGDPLRICTILFTVVADRGVRPDRSRFWLHKHVMVKRGQPIRQFSLCQILK